MGNFREFLIEGDIKKTTAKAEGLDLKGFDHATDPAGNHYEWNKEKSSWDKVIDSNTKEQILKKMKALGFEHSSFKQFKKDRAQLSDKGFSSKKTSASTPSLDKLKVLPENGRRFIINQRGDSYSVVAWAHDSK